MMSLFRSKKSYLIAIFALVLLIILAVISSLVYKQYFKKEGPVAYEGFARCLSERSAVFAGTEWCDDCKKTKALFGDAFAQIDYRNCDLSKRYCTDNSITVYPTWIFVGDRSEGFLSFEELSQKTGCRINE